LRAGLVILLCLVITVPAMAQPLFSGRPTTQKIGNLNREVRDLTVRIDQLQKQRTILDQEEGRLARKVAELKQSPSGMMRDAQLKATLKNMRAVLAKRRNVVGLERIIQTTLKTRQLALAGAAGKEAKRLMAQGERAVRAEDLEQALDRYARAFDYLALSRKPADHAPVPAPVRITGETEPDLPVRGNETPDELREIAQILRDNGEKVKRRASSHGKELSRLRLERETLTTLLATSAPSGLTGADALERIDRRIAELDRETRRLYGELVKFVGRAGNLEQQARREEIVLFREAARNLPREPNP